MKPSRFTVIIKIGQGKQDFVKYHNVTKLDSLERYCDRTFPDWRFINVYNPYTNEWMDCIKRNSPKTRINRQFNVIVCCSDGKYRKWKTCDYMDFIGFLNKSWEGWKFAKFYNADDRTLWKHFFNEKLSSKNVEKK